MRKIFTLFVVMCLYSMALMADPVISFSSKGKPTGWPDLTATVDNVPIESGASAAQSAVLMIVAPKVPYYHVEWYVNGELSKPADPYVLQWEVSGDCTVEACYVENFKMIFKDTPFVKYADENGVIIRPSNYYHHKYEKQRAFGYSVQSWTGSDGKNYLPDNIVTDTIAIRDTLTADVVMTPNYVLNEEDLGDATVTTVWEFGLPDSVATFNNVQSVFSFVKPTLYNSYYIDMNMKVDATNGWIDNTVTADNARDGFAEVGAGTRFRIPARYGSIYKMITKDALSKTTIADSTSANYKTVVDANGNYEATLFYYESTKDSIDIVIGEDIRLVSVSASWPGGDNYLSWTPEMKTDKDVLVTTAKSDPSGALLYDISNLTLNGGLKAVGGEALDSLSTQIEVPAEYDADKFLSVSFQMGEGFSFKHKKAFAQLRLVGANKSAKVKMTLSDDQGNIIESKLYEYVNADSVLLDTLANLAKPNDIYLYNRITMKIYVYGEADYYRLFMPITCSGEICEVLRFPEGYNFTPYVAKSEIDLDGIGLLAVDAYEVVGVDEEARHVTLNAIEEVPMGDIIVIHSDEAGAVHNIPLTRADDAYVRNNNKLYVSDGTVQGGRDIYRFTKEGNNYMFRRSATTDVLPDGEVYLKFHSATNADVFYLSEQDVPEKVAQLVFHETEDNRPLIEQYRGRTVGQATLDGHTFYKNHMWNTIALPFDVVSDRIEQTPLKDAEIWELDILGKEDYAAPTGFDATSGVLYLNFKPARSIEPGKPYVFEWRTTVASKIENPVFEDVTLKTSEASEMTVASSDGTVRFVATYAPVAMIPNCTANLYMGTKDAIEYPMSSMYVNAFSAYFLVDLGNGPGVPGEAVVKRVVMNIAGESDLPTRILDITLPEPVRDNAWYDLNGRRYTSLPNQRGIYIMNGKKVVVK